jgi:hypothetical protein
MRANERAGLCFLVISCPEPGLRGRRRAPRFFRAAEPRGAAGPPRLDADSRAVFDGVSGEFAAPAARRGTTAWQREIATYVIAKSMAFCVSAQARGKWCEHLASFDVTNRPRTTQRPHRAGSCPAAVSHGPAHADGVILIDLPAGSSTAQTPTCAE